MAPYGRDSGDLSGQKKAGYIVKVPGGGQRRITTQGGTIVKRAGGTTTGAPSGRVGMIVKT